MPSVIQQKKRGRPRKRYAPLAHRVTEWCARTGWSRSKAFDAMAAGSLRFLQDTPGAPRRIPTSEYVRLGFVRSADELRPPELVKPGT